MWQIFRMYDNKATTENKQQILFVQLDLLGFIWSFLGLYPGSHFVILS